MQDHQSDRPKAVPTTQADNDRVRVTEWRFAAGAETGWHLHGWDYVVVPQTDGLLLLETNDGNHDATLTAGQSYYRQAGVKHNVVNAGAQELVFIEVEMKAYPINEA